MRRPVPAETVGALPVSCAFQRKQFIRKCSEPSAFPVKAKSLLENRLPLLFAGICQQDQKPSPAELRQRITRPDSLHKRLAMQAKAEGVSLNQLAMYLLASGLKTAAS